MEEQSLSQEVSALDRKVDSWVSIPCARHLRPVEMAAELAMDDPNMTPASMPIAVMAFEVREIAGLCVCVWGGSVRSTAQNLQ